jgi:hypothetical protein
MRLARNVSPTAIPFGEDARSPPNRAAARRYVAAHIFLPRYPLRSGGTLLFAAQARLFHQREQASRWPPRELSSNISAVVWEITSFYRLVVDARIATRTRRHV